MDVLELLLTDADGADEARREHARRLTTFVRLLVHTGQGARAESTQLDLGGARDELERIAHADLGRALGDLLGHHLRESLGDEPFVTWEEPSLPYAEAWSRIEETRRSVAAVALPAVPAPGETPLAVARRLLAAWRDLAPADPSLDVWSARCLRAEEGPEAAEAAWDALLARDELAFEVELLAAAGRTECLLDRGAVLRARAWLDEQPEAVACDPALGRLAVWTALLAGDPAAARELNTSLPPWGGALPRALAELRRQRPEWLPLLSGREPVAPAGPQERRAPPARAALGADLVAVFALGPGRTLEAIHVDAAPALRGRVDDWIGSRDGACTAPRELEQRLIATAAPVVCQREGDEPLRGALSPAARARALTPVLHEAGDERGDVAGWVCVECEHHLLPSAARLARLARAHRDEVLACAEGRSASPTARPEEARAPLRDDPRAAAFRALVDGLGTKTALRRWWGFAVEAADTAAPAPVAQGGEALADWRERPGRGRAALRARAIAGPVVFDEPDPALSMHAAAASGVALPFVLRGRVTGLLVFESTRRRDFRPEDVERLVRALSGFSVPFQLALFRAWHRRRFGPDVVFDAEDTGFLARAFDLVAAGRSRAPVVVTGPAGVGKEVLARWLHFEGGDPEAPCEVLACGAASPAEVGRRLASAPGTLVLDVLDRLQPEIQARLMDHLTRPRPPGATGLRGPRLVATVRRSLADAVAAGRLRADLGQHLERMQLALPPLRRRRHEIPALAVLFARRFAAEEDLAEPDFEDEALALLWRQSWPGNVRELENLVYKLVLLHPGETLSVAPVRAVARRFGLELVRKLPSRHPEPDDLHHALHTTRRKSGAWNKTRAALYLGWDPDTLVARMRDARIEERTLFD